MKIFTANVALLLTVGLFACTASNEEHGTSVQDENALASALVAEPAVILDMNSDHDVAPFTTKEAALADQVGFLERTKESELTRCATVLHLPRASVFGRFGTCTMGLRETTFGFSIPPTPSKWEPTFQCDPSYCGAHSLDYADFIDWSGETTLATRSGQPLAKGSTVVLDVDFGAIAGFVADARIPEGGWKRQGVLAVAPHFFVRTSGTSAFIEAKGLVRLDSVGIGQGLGREGVLVVLPSDADRLEFYVRFERRNYTVLTVEQVQPVGVRLDQWVTDGYVSNFGKNYSIAVP